MRATETLSCAILSRGEGVEIEEAGVIVERLYADVRPYEISHDSRSQLADRDESFRYGEIVPTALNEMLREYPADDTRILYDLGSGTGRTVFLAALLFDFAKLVGVELLGGLHRAAQRKLGEYDAQIRPGLPRAKQKLIIEFRNEDIGETDFSEADVVVAHATCFQPLLMERLARQAERLKPGSRMILVGKSISSPMFSLEKVEPHEMDWGRTPVFFLTKISGPCDSEELP
ncbi:MAG: SAM-dependent methyltransferase [Acidobacteria bacterium]|nr:SAM-dependent methyltransferase [Acidobacteriota bacterium]